MSHTVSPHHSHSNSARIPTDLKKQTSTLESYKTARETNSDDDAIIEMSYPEKNQLSP